MCIVCYRKMPKTKYFNYFTISFPCKIPLKFKRVPPKIKYFQFRTCCKHSFPLSYFYWPVIAFLKQCGGWSGGAMMLGKLPVPGRPTIWITVGQGPIALAVGAGGGGLDIFTLIYPFSSFSLSLGDGPI